MPQPIEAPARHPRRFFWLRFVFYAFAILVIAGILLFTQYKPAPWEVTLRGSSTELGTACNAAQGTNYGTTRLDQILTAKETTVDQLGMQRVLAHPEVLMVCNIYSVIFDWRHNRLWLASGDTPAAAGGFREFPLFPQQ